MLSIILYLNGLKEFQGHMLLWSFTTCWYYALSLKLHILNDMEILHMYMLIWSFKCLMNFVSVLHMCTFSVFIYSLDCVPSMF